MQIGAVEGNCVRSKGGCEQYWFLEDNYMAKVRWKEEYTCSNCQRNDHDKNQEKPVQKWQRSWRTRELRSKVSPDRPRLALPVFAIPRVDIKLCES